MSARPARKPKSSTKSSRPPGKASRPKRKPSRSKSKPSRSKSKSASPKPPSDDRIRLQKVLASAGLGSRRQCEELIEAGRVEVDRKVVTEMGTRVDPNTQAIRVDGVALPRTKTVHYAVNKPAGVICTNSDPAGRRRAIDLVPADQGRLFTVGRLDLNSEGLLLVTNDGALANRLTHPRYGVEKTYHVLVAGHVTRDVLAKLKEGMHLAEGFARVKRVRVKRLYKQSTVLEMVLDEGRNREIRRLLARLEHKVLRLARVSIGPVRLGRLPSGQFRVLTSREINDLRHATKEPAG